MNKRRALRLGFAPFTPDLFDQDAEPHGYWKRTLQRPRCAQYWHPDQPQRLQMRRLDANDRPVGEMLDILTPSMRRTLHGVPPTPRIQRAGASPARQTHEPFMKGTPR